GRQCSLALATLNFQFGLAPFARPQFITQGLLFSLQSLLLIGQTLTFIEETTAFTFQPALFALQRFTLPPEHPCLRLKADNLSLKVLLVLLHVLASPHEV